MARKGENIYKRKDGRWEGRYKSGYDDSGKSKYHSVYGKTYQSVKEKLIALKSEPVYQNTSGNLTVKELFDEWMSAVRLRAKESTCAAYQTKFDKHILPELGGMRYKDLTVKMLHAFIDKKLKTSLSPKYVSDIVVVFKSMSKYISTVHKFYNPIADVALPKVTKSEMKLYDDFQQKKLCQYLMTHLNLTTLCVLISLYTGLRIGEICGLKWGDIDFDKSILTVNRTVQRIRSSDGKGTKLVITAPKSRTSKRSIPVPCFLMKLLSNYRGCSDSYILSGNENVTEPRTLQYRFSAASSKKSNYRRIQLR